MSKKFLIVVISCNRLFYLYNCIRSILEFGWKPEEAEYMIIDLGTVEQGIAGLLEDCQKKGFLCHRIPHRTDNELYIGMNYAVNYSISNNIPYIYFIQEDQQFVWKDEHFLQRISSIFEKEKNVYLVQPSIPRRCPIYITPDLDLRWQEIGDTRYYKYNLIYHDYAVIRTEFYKITGLYPDFTSTHSQYDKDKSMVRISGEHWTRYRVYERYPYMEMAELRFGHTIMIPDICVVRGPVRYGHYVPPSKGMYIDPLEKKSLDILHSNEFKVFEDEIIHSNIDLKTLDIDTNIKTHLGMVPYYPNELSYTFPFKPKQYRHLAVAVTESSTYDQYTYRLKTDYLFNILDDNPSIILLD